MLSRNIKRWLTVAALLGCSLAMAQSEPTLNQVYEAANAGKLEQAQVMMQQVLVAHPDSGKAHFVQAELSARQGNLSRARDELALAEKLAPGLPFAKSGAAQNLRNQLAAKGSSESTSKAATSSSAPVRSAAPASAASSFPWGMALALGAGVLALVVFLTRKKAPAPAQPQPFAPAASAANAQGSGLSGPQTFGAASGAGPASGQPGYGQPAYGHAAGNGLGGKVMGGLATGLAVGAGVMAAQAIGKNLMGGNNNENPAHPQAAADNGHEALAGNSDLGGQNFGVSDAGSWDDAGVDVAGGMDGGGDWDS
jgi:uncharacterized protein